MGYVLESFLAGAPKWGCHLMRRVAPLWVGLCSVSCLIGPPEPLLEEEQVRPQVVPHTIYPPRFSYVEYDNQKFRVEFFSEDLNEKVVARLYTNIDTSDFYLINSAELGPGSLSDPQPRVVEMDWQGPTVGAGCYVVTMTITHLSNYSNNGTSVPIDPNKTAYVSWWVVKDIAPQDLTFDQCPAPAPDLSTEL